MKILELTKKANKIFRNGYGLRRNLGKDEIAVEAHNLIRKYNKGNLDDMQERMFFQMEISQWEELAK
jgi:hypothetical protein